MNLAINFRHSIFTFFFLTEAHQIKSVAWLLVILFLLYTCRATLVPWLQMGLHVFLFPFLKLQHVQQEMAITYTALQGSGDTIHWCFLKCLNMRLFRFQNSILNQIDSHPLAHCFNNNTPPPSCPCCGWADTIHRPSKTPIEDLLS